MKKSAFLFLLGTFFLSGCYSEKAALKKHGLWVGYVPGPFFHYGQAELSQSRRFDLGMIKPGTGEISAYVPFSNPGRELLMIEKAESESPYFVRLEGDRQLEAGQKGQMRLVFDMTGIETGPVMIGVQIYTNDPANQKVDFYFEFEVVKRN